MKTTILFVEDDEFLALIVKDYFESKGYRVIYHENAEKGLNAFRKYKIDICLLDVCLPHKNGFTLAEEIKSIDQDVPILFLTAQKEKEDITRGFEIGADDYIRKPFLPDEVYMRVKAILKRTNTKTNMDSKNTIVKIGKYEFDYEFQTLKFPSFDKVLSFKETQLLKLLFENHNQVISKETIYKKVWKSDDFGLSRSVDVYIAKLRKYLENDKNIQIINIRGIGYKMLIES